MGFSIRLTNLGIEMSWHEGSEPKPLQPAPDADQENQRGNYVYAHLDNAGNIFYIGKGVEKRAWSPDRHPLWGRYVQNHLNGNYRIQILQDNLSPMEAERIEATWIAECGDALVNWMNMGRKSDYKALDQYHKLRRANRSLIQEAKAEEKHDLERAVAMYFRAIEEIPTYAFMSFEKGLVGKLHDEEAAEVGRNGELEALERLTMCLIGLGKVDEAARHAEGYYALYARDRHLRASERIAKRINKALARKRPQ